MELYENVVHLFLCLTVFYQFKQFEVCVGERERQVAYELKAE